MPHGYVAALRGFLLLFLVTLPFTMIGSFHGFAIFGEALIAYIFLDLVCTSPHAMSLLLQGAYFSETDRRDA